MDSTVVTSTPILVKTKKPDWRYHLKDSNATLHEAISLSLNCDPTRMTNILSAKAISEASKKKARIYAKRLRAARLEMPEEGAIIVLEETSKEDGSDWIIDLRSFVEFALHRGWGRNNDKFKLLGIQSLPQKNEDNEMSLSGEKAPRASATFLADLLRLFVEISRRAATNGMEFDVNQMPGQKVQLHEIAAKFSDKLDLKESTFNTYLKGLCKFTQAPQKSDFYKTLFPDYFRGEN